MIIRLYLHLLAVAALLALAFGIELSWVGTAQAQEKPRTFTYSGPPRLPDNVGVLGVPTTHWLNTSRGIRICTDKQGFFAGSLTADHKRVDKCTRPYTLSQYVQAMAGRGAYATNITRLAQGQLTIEYVLPL